MLLNHRDFDYDVTCNDEDDINVKRRQVFESFFGDTYEPLDLFGCLERADIPHSKEVCCVCQQKAKQLCPDDSERCELISFIFSCTFDFDDSDMEIKKRNPIRVINESLISGETLNIHNVCPLVYGVLKALRSLPLMRYYELNRGIDKRLDWKKDNEIVFPAFTFFTKDTMKAYKFIHTEGKYHKGTLLTVYCLWGYDISEYSEYPGDEVLVEPFQSLYISFVSSNHPLICIWAFDKGTTNRVLLDKLPLLETDIDFHLLGDALLFHKSGKRSDAIREYERGVENGDQLSCFNLGNCYMFKMGVDRDESKALELYERGGLIDDKSIPWMKEMSNDRFVREDDNDLYRLFFLFSFLLSYYVFFS